MKTETEIKEEALAVLEQLRGCDGTELSKRLKTTYNVLQWVLGNPKAAKHLTYSEEAANFLKSLW